MKKFGILLACFVVSAMAWGQLHSDSVHTTKKELPKSEVKNWRIDERFGFKDSVAVDTAITSYQDNNPVNNYSIANSWNGNLGSPLQSKIYFDRTRKTDYIFSSAYDAYVLTPQDVSFFNTKIPYSQLVYRSATPKFSEEDYLKVLLSLNANKRLNVGGMCNYIYGRGQYSNQGSELINGGFWMSYENKHYSGNAVIMFNHFKNYENGGITNPQFITDPLSLVGSSTYTPRDIPTNLSGVFSQYKNDVYYYNHRYRFGKDVEKVINEDSTVTEFVPISSIIHTIKFENARRHYAERSVATAFYDTTYLNNKFTNDSTHYMSLRNMVAFTLEEDFNKLMRFGLAAFVEHDLRRRATIFDSVPQAYYENYLTVGARIYKEKGKNLTYHAQFDINALGQRAGDLEAFGDIQANFFVKDDVLKLTGGVGFYSETPDNFLQHFSSNHFRWDNDFKRQVRLNANVRFSVPTRDISVGAKFETVQNFIYFDTLGLPRQHNQNLQVLAIDATANVRFWRFHLDNQVVYQLTSNREVLPLPDLSLYSTFYYKDKWFKVLTAQIGMSVRYNTAYFSPVYVPATGQFRLQNKELVGNYPVLNAYVNLHIKRMRLFAQYSHWNSGVFSIKNAFAMPNYPLNPGTFQFGFSWTFAN